MDKCMARVPAVLLITFVTNWREASTCELVESAKKEERTAGQRYNFTEQAISGRICLEDTRRILLWLLKIPGTLWPVAATTHHYWYQAGNVQLLSVLQVSWLVFNATVHNTFQSWNKWLRLKGHYDLVCYCCKVQVTCTCRWHLDVCHSRRQISTQYVRLQPVEFAILLTPISGSHIHTWLQRILKLVKTKTSRLAHLFVLLPQQLPFLHDGLELGRGVGLTKLGKGCELWAKSPGRGKGLLQLLLRSEADVCKDTKTSNQFPHTHCYNLQGWMPSTEQHWPTSRGK